MRKGDPFPKVLRRASCRRFVVGVLRIPLDIVVAVSLAHALSSVAGSNLDGTFVSMGLFAVATALRLSLVAFEKTRIALLGSDAEQSMRQLFYQRFMRGTSALHRSEPASFLNLFRRDIHEIVRYRAEVLPSILAAGVGAIAYTLYISIALNGALFALFMILFSMLNLIPPLVMDRYLMKNFMEAGESEAELSQHLASGVEGFVMLKMLKLHSWYMKKYRARQKGFWRIGVRASASGSLMGAMDMINSFLQTLGLVAVLGYGMLMEWITFERGMQIFLLSANVYGCLVTLFHMKQYSATHRAAQMRLNEYIPDESPISPAPLGDGRESLGLSLRDIRYAIEDRTLFEEVNFDLNPGEKCLITGENGSGKSTLLALILGQMKPEGGQIRMGGVEILHGIPPLNERIAYCPQAMPTLHCTPQELYDYAAKASQRISRTILHKYTEKLNLSAVDMHKPIHELSGGTQKKVALCLALAKESSLLLLDEPEAMLDRETLEALLMILREQKRTMLIVSHIHAFDDMADSRVVLSGQRVEHVRCAETPVNALG